MTGVSLSPKTSTAEAGDSGSRQLNATVIPEDATNKDVSYEIAPEVEGISVNNSGLIEWTDNTAAGEYTTTVTTIDGSFTDTHVLTLTETDPEEGD